MCDLLKKYEKLDNWGKVEFLTQLEFQDNEEKWNLLSQIILDSKEYDLARIEALKILEVASIPTKYKDTLARCICSLIKNEKDYDIKNYAGIAAVNFIEYSCIQNICIQGLLDCSEDIDLRYNYLTVLLKMNDKKKVRDVLEKMVGNGDAGLAKTVERNLRLLENG